MIIIVLFQLCFDSPYSKLQSQDTYRIFSKSSHPLMFVMVENLMNDLQYAADFHLGPLMNHDQEDEYVLVDFLKCYQKGKIAKNYLDEKTALVTDVYLRRMRRSGMRFSEFRISASMKKESNFSTYRVRLFSDSQNYLASIVLTNSKDYQDRKIVAVNFENLGIKT